MQFDLASIETLMPYAGNSRTHPAKQIKAIKKSIESFGFVAGAIVVRSGVLAKGHATLQAIQMIFEDGGKLYPPPGKKKKAKPYPAGQVPVVDASKWDEEQFKAFVVTDNRISEMAGWDRLILAQELPEIVEPDLAELLGEIDVGKIVELHNMGERFNFTAPDYFGKEKPKEDEGESDDDEAEEAAPADGTKYPVTFVLDGAEWQDWLTFKKAFPKLSQKEVFMRAIKL